MYIYIHTFTYIFYKSDRYPIFRPNIYFRYNYYNYMATQIFIILFFNNVAVCFFAITYAHTHTHLQASLYIYLPTRLHIIVYTHTPTYIDIYSIYTKKQKQS